MSESADDELSLNCDINVCLVCSYRRQIANGSLEAGAGIPASSNMRLVTWDPELASLAQAWADQCPGGRIEGEEVRVAIIGDQRIEVGGDQD